MSPSSISMTDVVLGAPNGVNGVVATYRLNDTIKTGVAFFPEAYAGAPTLFLHNEPILVYPTLTEIIKVLCSMDSKPLENTLYEIVEGYVYVNLDVVCKSVVLPQLV
ncbi:MAG: hypothetical protein GY883_18355 [Shimia sp.]|nr:hypothetical protein [Shimia sp.]